MIGIYGYCTLLRTCCAMLCVDRYKLSAGQQSYEVRLYKSRPVVHPLKSSCRGAFCHESLKRGERQLLGFFSRPYSCEGRHHKRSIPAGMQKWPSDHRLLFGSGRVSRAFSSSICQAQGPQDRWVSASFPEKGRGDGA